VNPQQDRKQGASPRQARAISGDPMLIHNFQAKDKILGCVVGGEIDPRAGSWPVGLGEFLRESSDEAVLRQAPAWHPYSG
jgi:hypothetical protein